MEQQLARVLAQGMADGKGPREIVRLLNKTISGPVGDLGITDTLGRFIPAERRAQILARTEIIRAHHVATINEYRNWEVEGVKVKAEWQTAGDGRVCSICAALDGKTFSLDKIENMIPAHPQCRCVALPVDITEEAEQIEQWKPAESISELHATFMNEFSITIGSSLDEARTLRRGNVIGENLKENIYAKFPRLSEQGEWASMSDSSVLLELDASRCPAGYADRSGVLGVYNSGAREIRIGTRPLVRTKSKLKLGGKWNVGTDLGSVFRHEYGHHVFVRFITGAQQRRWRKFFLDKGEKWWKKHVSGYASTDVEEAWAEVFSAYTSSHYGVDARFPEELETLIEDIMTAKMTSKKVR